MQGKTLEDIKNRVFNRQKAPTDDDTFIRLCELVESCGGYQNFMETPLAVIVEMGRMLDRRYEDRTHILKSLFGSKKA